MRCRPFGRMRKSVKAGILWYIQGSMSFIQMQFPHVFKPSGEDDAIVNVFDYQQRIIDSLAEGDVTKKNQVRQSLLYDALYSMEMAAIRIEKYEKENKRNKKITAMYNHFKYTEKLATQLAPIAHTDHQPRFFRATEQTEMVELNEKINKVKGMIMVAIDGSTLDIKLNNTDSLMERPGYSLVIAKQTKST